MLYVKKCPLCCLFFESSSIVNVNFRCILDDAVWKMTWCRHGIYLVCSEYSLCGPEWPASSSNGFPLVMKDVDDTDRTPKLNLGWGCARYQSIHVRFIKPCIFFSRLTIKATCPCNVDPIIHHFYKVKLGCTWEYIIFLIFALKHRLLVLVRNASNMYPLSMFLAIIR